MLLQNKHQIKWNNSSFVLSFCFFGKKCLLIFSFFRSIDCYVYYLWIEILCTGIIKYFSSVFVLTKFFVILNEFTLKMAHCKKEQKRKQQQQKWSKIQKRNEKLRGRKEEKWCRDGVWKKTKEKTKKYVRQNKKTENRKISHYNFRTRK